jgi:hypothetical protein
MRRADRQRELLDDIPGIGDWDLIILDEAHHARRRGAGSAQEKGPNRLLGLMQKLQAKCRSLLLLTATRMQVHPVELWDLMDLLGLPDEWRRDDGVFLRYFQRASGNPGPEDLDERAGAETSACMIATRRFSTEILATLREGKGLRIRAGNGMHRFIGIWVVVVNDRAENPALLSSY